MDDLERKIIIMETQIENLKSLQNELKNDQKNVKEELEDLKKDINSQFEIVLKKLNEFNDNVQYQKGFIKAIFIVASIIGVTGSGIIYFIKNFIK